MQGETGSEDHQGSTGKGSQRRGGIGSINAQLEIGVSGISNENTEPFL
jgi:hypothetical protein